MATEIGLARMECTYQGLIDDKVSEYPWAAQGLEPAGLNLILRRSALFEGPLLLLDGYLLHFPWLRNQLFNPRSLLRRLIEEQKVIILSRDPNGRGDLARTVEHLATTVPSYHQLRTHENWPRWRDSLLQLWEAPGYHFASVPSVGTFDNRQGFDLLVRTVAGLDRSELCLRTEHEAGLDLVVGRYLELRKEEENTGARTLWERASRSVGIPGLAVASMHLGNSLYHYNWSLALAAASRRHVQVSSIASRALCSRFGLPAPNLPRTPVALPPELLHLPTEAFIDLVQDTTESRADYLRSISSSPDGPARTESAEADQALGGYIRALASHLACRHAVTRSLGKGVELARKSRDFALAAKPLLPSGDVKDALEIWGLLLNYFDPHLGTLPHSVATWHAARLEGRVRAHFGTGSPGADIGFSTATVALDHRRAQSHIGDLLRVPSPPSPAGPPSSSNASDPGKLYDDTAD